MHTHAHTYTGMDKGEKLVTFEGSRARGEIAYMR